MPFNPKGSKLPPPVTITDRIVEFKFSEDIKSYGAEPVKISAVFKFEKLGEVCHHGSYDLGSLGEAGWSQGTIKNGFLKDLTAMYRLSKKTNQQSLVLQVEDILAPYRPESIPYTVELVFDPDETSYLPALVVDNLGYRLNHDDIAALGEWLCSNCH